MSAFLGLFSFGHIAKYGLLKKATVVHRGWDVEFSRYDGMFRSYCFSHELHRGLAWEFWQHGTYHEVRVSYLSIPIADKSHISLLIDVLVIPANQEFIKYSVTAVSTLSGKLTDGSVLSRVKTLFETYKHALLDAVLSGELDKCRDLGELRCLGYHVHEQDTLAR